MNLLTIRAAAEQIGYSKKTLENWIFRGALPFPFLKTQTGRIRIREADIEKWIKESMTVIMPGETDKPQVGEHTPKAHQKTKP